VSPARAASRARQTAGALGFLSVLAVAGPAAAELPDTIARVKPSIVAVGSFQRTRSPAFRFSGTGFIVGDGTLVATNAHVVREQTDAAAMESLTVIVRPPGRDPEPRTATKIATDPERDLALLRIAGPPLPALVLREAGAAREGEMLAFTGFPIGNVLGFFPVTHRAMVSSITPIAIPGQTAGRLDSKTIRRLTAGTFPVLQLDATSYPGNSGSPLYHPDSGEVLGILNMALVKSTKESALTDPSGISYAIPVEHLHGLLRTIR
jgi:S1-C subfamily serine protease